MSETASPSLFGNAAAGAFSAGDSAFTPHNLMDLMYDGFYALFLLKSQSAPKDYTTFANTITHFLGELDRNAKKLGVSADDIHAAKYAFCAAVDETVLRSNFSIRGEWERKPLQLTLFGDQLAGEHFFTRLDALRHRGGAHIQVLEVYHLCLLLGFEGKYMIEGQEKLHYLTARLGDEIALLKGKGHGFAPHWDRPDHIINKLRNEIPLWMIGTVFAVIGLAGYGGFDWVLSNATLDSLSRYSGVIQMPPETANITITLP